MAGRFETTEDYTRTEDAYRESKYKVLQGFWSGRPKEGVIKFNKSLVKAIEKNNCKKVEILLKIAEEAKVLEKLPDKPNLLKIAMNFSHHGTKTFKSLAKRFPEQLVHNTERQETLLHIAVARQDHTGAELILKCWQDKSDVVLHEFIHVPLAPDSSQAGSCQEVELPLSMAAWNGDRKMMNLLLEFGASMKEKNSREQNVFHSLVQMTSNLKGHEIGDVKKTVEFLIQKASGNVENRTRGENASKTKEKATPTKNEPKTKSVATQTEKVTRRERDEISTLQNLADMLNAKDKNGYTPLTLSAKVGCKELFEVIVNSQVYKVVDRKSSTSNVYLYDITEIDSVVSEPGKSAMDLIMTGSREKAKKYYELAEICPVLDIIKDKWTKYKLWYYAWGLVHLIFMSLYTLFSATRYAGPPLAGISSDALSVIANLLLFVYSIILAVQEIPLLVQQIRRKDNHLELLRNQLRNGPYQILSILLALSTFAAFVTQFVSVEKALIPQTLSLIFGWLFMLFFTRGFRLFSSFTVMIQLALEDVAKFAVVYVIILVPYAASMVMLHNLPVERQNMYNNSSELQNDQFTNFWRSSLTMFSLMLGLADVDETFQDAEYPGMAIFLYIAFLVTSYILLLNMVIALLSDTCTQVSSTKQDQWHLQKLGIVLFIESRLLKRHRHASGSPQEVYKRGGSQPQLPKQVDGRLLPEELCSENDGHDTSNRYYFKVKTVTQRTLAEIHKARSVAKALGWMKSNNKTVNTPKYQDNAETPQTSNQSTATGTETSEEPGPLNV